MTATKVIERLVNALERGAEADVLWTSKHVCAFLGIHENTLYKLIRDEGLPTVQFGGRHKRFIKADVIRWVARKHRTRAGR